MRLIRIDGTEGLVETEGVVRSVSLVLIDNPGVGDYLIVHAGCAINRIDEAAALETLETLKNVYGIESPGL
jgi:hydrogenase expression/formation protein HypC